jgi:hypothetical protein
MPKISHEDDSIFVDQDCGFEPDVTSYMTLKGEVVQAIIVPEIDAQLKTTYVDRPEGPLLAGCSDERTITEASAGLIKDNLDLEADGPILRIFGAATGAARISLVAKIAEHGADTAARFTPEGFIDYTGDLISRARQKAEVVYAVHSAAKNEQNEHSLNLKSAIGLGCAHAANTGAVSALSAHNPRVLEVAALEGESIFGEKRMAGFKRVSEANYEFIQTVLAGDENYSVERQDFAELGVPVMVLQGDHLKPAETLVVENFSVGKLADPRLSGDMNRLHYTYDMTQQAATIIKSFPDVKFDPEILLLAMHLDIVATRAALAGGEPTDLKLQRYGNVDEAIAYLAAL